MRTIYLIGLALEAVAGVRAVQYYHANGRG